MDFKLVSKNNLGVVVALSLVILLSQSKFFNFLLDTALGRAILIMFIIFISYSNKILGVVSVLFIIIMFNNSDIGYIEGFNSSSPDTNPSSSINNSSNVMTNVSDNNNSNSTNLNGSKLTDEQKQQLLKNIQSKLQSKENTLTSSTAAATPPVEGFDMASKERHIQMGKKPNSIPVSSFMKSSDHVEPFTGNSQFFSNLYSNF